MAERKGNIGARENKALAQTKGERTKMQNKSAFGSRIREYRIKKGLSQPQLAALLGVTKNAVTNWEAGASRPDIASIPALCTHLGISADTFFDMPAQYRALNAAEAAHMERYRLLDRYRQRSVDALMDALIENEMLAFREQCVSAFTRIGRDELPASAGTGTPLDDTYEREYVFLRNSRSVCRADTIITVTGDSMLPTFRDGDELLVEYTPEIREGEIGIFVVAGEGFVKEYRSDGLHSHNPKYKTIRPMQDDNFRCVGRVLGAVTEDMLATPQELAVLSEVYSSRQDS